MTDGKVKWIKIVTDIFDDEKILLIENMPDADCIIVLWFKLLCLAGKQNNGGVFVLTNTIPYTDEMLATIFRRPVNTVRLALEVFERFGMIERIENVITIPNWSKHQSLDSAEKRRERDRIYQQNRRNALRALSNPTESSDNRPTSADASPDVAPLEEDIEEDIDKEVESSNNDSKKKTKVFTSIDRPYLCALFLSKRISSRLPSAKEATEKTLQRWADAFDKCNRIDGHDWDEIKYVLAFSQDDPFWQANILSGKTFREKYMQLLAKWTAAKNQPQAKGQESTIDRAMRLEREGAFDE